MLVVYIVSRQRVYGNNEKFMAVSGGSPIGVIQALREAIFPLLMPVIILGGIYGGVFTPTEAAIVAVFYALLLGFGLYRTLNLSNLLQALRASVTSAVAILLIIAAASVFGWVLTANRIPDLIAQSFISFSDSPYIFLLLVNALLLVVGMFLETGAAIIILAPILTPVAVSMGVDPVHFGIIMIVNLAVGMTTPPIGVNL